MERRRGPVVDGISRVLSLFAVLAGISGGYLLYNENQQIKQELAKVSVGSLDSDLSGGIAAAVDPTGNDSVEVSPDESSEDVGSATGNPQTRSPFNRSSFEQELTHIKADFEQALNQFKLDANATLKRDDEANSARTRILLADRMDLARLRERVEEIKDIVMVPRLTVPPVESRAKGSYPPARVTNEGPADALVQSATFRTRDGEQFATKDAMNVPDDDTLVLDFFPEDNKSPIAGRHTDYEREFGADTVIPSNGTVNVVIQIHNPRHVGWGWLGDLDITYDDGREITIPAARAVFVADDTDSI